jgi:hypothetical protein
MLTSHPLPKEPFYCKEVEPRVPHDYLPADLSPDAAITFMTAKMIEKLVNQALLHEGKMEYALNEHELIDVLGDLGNASDLSISICYHLIELGKSSTIHRSATAPSRPSEACLRDSRSASSLGVIAVKKGIPTLES